MASPNNNECFLPCSNELLALTDDELHRVLDEYMLDLDHTFKRYVETGLEVADAYDKLLTTKDKADELEMVELIRRCIKIWTIHTIGGLYAAKYMAVHKDAHDLEAMRARKKFRKYKEELADKAGIQNFVIGTDFRLLARNLTAEGHPSAPDANEKDPD